MGWKKIGALAHKNGNISEWRKDRKSGSVGVSRVCPILGVPRIISGTGKATDFKFGRYTYRVHPSKSPLKILRKGTVGVSRDSPILWGTPYYLRSS